MKYINYLYIKINGKVTIKRLDENGNLVVEGK